MTMLAKHSFKYSENASFSDLKNGVAVGGQEGADSTDETEIATSEEKTVDQIKYFPSCFFPLP